ncbi:anti-sigma regulatory factor (Ser/Thr protein kinase) [Thermocatellispora tengchongensis]|uniref:Anti-sigma regulatory factor (Ser/Thr protein kinase) n=1 Tax=Thermocatellispora tengchongensis TaxID=1073253 RepID=A0A840P0D3_9ACTN|nr:ATP-binding protein [Thermocatellispora tengchongensis]MBB5132842.1 anti-sigma regulatory factor (Ser/Thr protein kinase) [Thermocatellispora tengchongensis]
MQSANLGVLRANGRPGPHQGQAPAQHGQQSAQCRQGVQGSAQAQWTTLDWWPPLGWWPDAARDLLPPVPESAMASATFVLPARPDSVHCSRSFATGTLSGWCLPELRENMELVVSELCTNAIRHGLRLTPGGAREPEAIRLSLVRRGGLVVCAIGDPGSAAPVLRDPASLEPGGLGLHIVESLSLRWGWAPLAPYGKVVWAVLSG